ncbi:uncharacterized protein RAG0_11832 [Rhynchosporium agropyri]|uniref:2EXR domain-containing protein n=1 Tax=Rhynchosporium agropyri TaxID=914238 RepID=A0A1E1L5W3_9HELO|nr:uncharacterized protein RAG0_11832 [Rhynchosporium agropyri]
MTTRNSVASHKFSPVFIDLTGSDDESDWDIDWDIELEISSLQPQDSGQAIQRVESTIKLSASEETKLLHSAQEAGGSQVAVSGDQVAKLLGTIAALRTQLAILATPKVDSGDAPTLLRIAGKRLGLSCGDFTLFPKLPIELRSMIWQFASLVPQIHRFLYDYETSEMPKSVRRTNTISSLRFVCQETRAVAVRYRERMSLTRHWWKLKPRTFIHEEIDVAFFMSKSTDVNHPSEECMHNILEQMTLVCPYLPLRLPRIALKAQGRASVFGDTDGDRPLRAILKVAEACQIEDLIFVTGTDYVCESSDVVFVRPSKTPREILSKNQIKTMFKNWKLPETPDLTWQFAEEQDAKML